MKHWLVVPITLAVAACGGASEPQNGQVDLRNLVATNEAGAAPAGYAMEGDLIPTPSDTQSTYRLLRTRDAVNGPLISIIRQQRGDRVVYARTETDCAAGLFHIAGVGDSRGEVEVDVVRNGPLRSIEGLPLRRELASFICRQVGEPLVEPARAS